MTTITDRLQAGIKTISIEAGKGALYGLSTGLSIQGFWQTMLNYDPKGKKENFLEKPIYYISKTNSGEPTVYVNGNYLPFLCAGSGALLGSIYGIRKLIFGDPAQRNLSTMVKFFYAATRGAVEGACLGLLTSQWVRAIVSVEDPTYDITTGKTVEITAILFNNTVIHNTQLLPKALAVSGFFVRLYTQALLQ